MPSVIVKAIQSDGQVMPMRIHSGMTIKVSGLVKGRYIAEEVSEQEFNHMSIDELKNLLDTLKHNFEPKGSGNKGKVRKEDYIKGLMKYWHEWFDGSDCDGSDEEDDEVDPNASSSTCEAAMGDNEEMPEQKEELNPEKTEKKIDDEPEWSEVGNFMMACKTCNMAWDKSSNPDCKCKRRVFDYKALCRNNDTELKTINIVWKGSRSGDKNIIKVKGNMKIGEFKTYVFNNFHGIEIDSQKYQTEHEFTSSHNVMVLKSNKLLDRDNFSFADYNMLDDGGVPYEVSFCLGLDGGMPAQRRKRVEDVNLHMQMEITDVDTVKAVFNLNLPALKDGIQAPEFQTADIQAMMDKTAKEKNMPRIITWAVQRSRLYIDLLADQDHKERRYEVAHEVLMQKFEKSFQDSYLSGTRWNIDKLREDLAEERGTRNVPYVPAPTPMQG